MTSGPFLMTERLILRPPATEDLDGWAVFAADENSARFIGGAKSRAEAWRDLCTMRGAWDIRGFSMFSMIRRDTGEWIGRTGPWQPEDWPGTEVGWGIISSAEGKGYAYEAAVASVDYAFDVLGWDQVIHTINPENTGSIALAQRLGSKNLGPTQMPAPYETLRVDAWGQSKAEWKARPKNGL